MNLKINFMKKEILFRTLYASEIEVRPAHVDKATGKVNLLLYIDSRAVVSLLNETVGNLNWQSNLYEVNGQMIGEIGLYDEKRDIWVWKSDTGSESNIEKEKGLVSDIYKRVLSRWGVTELYSSPTIKVDNDGYGNKGYRVSEIGYNSNREINHLVIINRFGQEVYRMSNKQKEHNKQPLNNTSTETSSNNIEIIQSIKDFANNEYSKDKSKKAILEKFVSYYSKKINEGSWSGKFDCDYLFKCWQQKELSKSA
jgi:hypothetical protein